MKLTIIIALALTSLTVFAADKKEVKVEDACAKLKGKKLEACMAKKEVKAEDKKEEKKEDKKEEKKEDKKAEKAEAKKEDKKAGKK